MIHIPDISKGCTSAAQWKLHTGKKRWRCDGVLQRMHTSCTMKKFNTKRVKIWSRINGNIVMSWRQATQDPGPKNTKPGKGLLQNCAWKIVHWAALNLQRVNHRNRSIQFKHSAFHLHETLFGNTHTPDIEVTSTNNSTIRRWTQANYYNKIGCSELKWSPLWPKRVSKNSLHFGTWGVMHGQFAV